MVLCNLGKARREFVRVGNGDRHQVHPERSRGGDEFIGRVIVNDTRQTQHCHAAGVCYDFMQHLQALAEDVGGEHGQTGQIAAGV